MKELSIEEKAKAYDEALKVLHKYDGANIMFSQSLKEEMFPELKESEDDRIRKEMIFYFQEEIPQCSIQEHADKMREFISWLKRQEVECTKLELKAGNSYFCYKSRWERADSETFKKGLIYKCNKDGVLDNFVIKNPEQHFIEIKDERIAWLEKQGEQPKKHDVCDYCDQQGCCVSPCPMKLVEKHGEKKPADTPKFKVGDFIANDYCFGKVIALTDDAYLLDTGQSIPFSCEHNAHLWTIQDAKDGDVLAIEWNQDNDVWEKILIFKALNDSCVKGYGSTFKNKNLFFTDQKVPYYSETWTKTLHPATKEQRDLLFQKMHEAGYEWDAKKKELKKIKQSAWSEEDE